MRELRRRLPLVALGLAATVAAGAAGTAEARFTDAAAADANSVSTATLQAPTGLVATAGCSGATPTIALGWTASTSAFADGYDVFRAPSGGGPFTPIAHVSGGSATSYTDAAGLSLNTRYFYVARSTAFLWTSVDSKSTNARTSRTCP